MSLTVRVAARSGGAGEEAAAALHRAAAASVYQFASCIKPPGTLSEPDNACTGGQEELGFKESRSGHSRVEQAQRGCGWVRARRSARCGPALCGRAARRQAGGAGAALPNAAPPCLVILSTLGAALSPHTVPGVVSACCVHVWAHRCALPAHKSRTSSLPNTVVAHPQLPGRVALQLCTTSRLEEPIRQRRIQDRWGG